MREDGGMMEVWWRWRREGGVVAAFWKEREGVRTCGIGHLQVVLSQGEVTQDKLM